MTVVVQGYHSAGGHKTGLMLSELVAKGKQEVAGTSGRFAIWAKVGPHMTGRKYLCSLDARKAVKFYRAVEGMSAKQFVALVQRTYRTSQCAEALRGVSK